MIIPTTHWLTTTNIGTRHDDAQAFLCATTHIYLCETLSVGRSVSWSVMLSFNYLHVAYLALFSVRVHEPMVLYFAFGQSPSFMAPSPTCSVHEMACLQRPYLFQLGSKRKFRMDENWKTNRVDWDEIYMTHKSKKFDLSIQKPTLSQYYWKRWAENLCSFFCTGFFL